MLLFIGWFVVIVGSFFLVERYGVWPLLMSVFGPPLLTLLVALLLA